MNTILVLGLIPGTNIQISFQAWLGIITVLIGAALIFLIELNLRRRGRQTTVRKPLLANQLHQPE